jgi:hypothetical protein
MRWLHTLLATSLLLAPAVTSAEEEPNIEFFFDYAIHAGLVWEF